MRASQLPARLQFEFAKRRHLLRKRREHGAPVVVFAMAKTGTSALAAGLRAAGVAPLFQVHDLDRRFLAEEEVQYHWSGRPWRNWDAQALLSRPASQHRRWRVITLVRDPIAQSVSAFFQPGERKRYLGADVTVDDLLVQFGDRLHSLPLRWFETHVESTLGIDVYAHDFDPRVGHAVIDMPDVQLLLLRSEGLDKAAAAVADFVGLDQPLTFPQANVGSTKSYGPLYHAFLARLSPSNEVLETAYSSRLVRHFYTGDERARFRTSWSIPGPATPPVSPIDA